MRRAKTAGVSLRLYIATTPGAVSPAIIEPPRFYFCSHIAGVKGAEVHVGEIRCSGRAVPYSGQLAGIGFAQLGESFDVFCRGRNHEAARPVDGVSRDEADATNFRSGR